MLYLSLGLILLGILAIVFRRRLGEAFCRNYEEDWPRLEEYARKKKFVIGPTPPLNREDCKLVIAICGGVAIVLGSIFLTLHWATDILNESLS
ncbi:MAG: hypothetical protein CMO55_10270 [Verrucomicrobiales bacterium]|nr:hypothetical protein [Verrucomicrobiales bacterium]